MITELGWKVGGEQGEGIDSTGEIFAWTLHRLGYYVYAYRHFMSRVKGGHTNYKIRVADRQNGHHGDDLHVLVAFDQETVNYNWHELTEDAVVIAEGTTGEIVPPEEANVHFYPIPLTGLAREAGNAIMKNMVAVGVSAAIVGLTPEDFLAFIEDKFQSKGPEVVASNLNAVRVGYNYYNEHFGNVHFNLPPKPQNQSGKRLLISGNEALALGALTAGCRVFAAYPITPATEIMYAMVKYMPMYGGAVIQTEDEIAAVNMALGANFAGARAMTSTSGPGFSLMMETLGLAGMSETPLVIVDVQRSGPSTGLPTKTEQSDINEMLYGSHGEFPRIVLAPTSIEECFVYGMEAFNLAEKYQCPVIVASDLYMGMSKGSVDGLDISRVHIDRGKLVGQKDLAGVRKGEFKRYEITADGISPRAVPGLKGGKFIALGNEHNEYGIEMEDQIMRTEQVNKRARKLYGFNDLVGVSLDGPVDAELALVGFGSTKGLIKEAKEALESQGMKVSHVQVSLLNPFPVEVVRPYIEKAENVIVVELNSTGQLAGQLREHYGHQDHIAPCLKYNGDPMTVKEVLARVREVFSSGNR